MSAGSPKSPVPGPIPMAYRVPRCLRCGYVLEGLPEPRCPECGRPFDLNNPATYNTKPPFVRWKYWLPGLLLSLGGGLGLYVFVWAVSGFGWATTLVVPFAAGALLGYACRVRIFSLVLLSLIVLTALILGLFSLNIVGVFCGLVLAGIALGPLLIGSLTGWAAGHAQAEPVRPRWHLPTLVFLIGPMLWGAIEGRPWRPAQAETVTTSVIIPASVGRAWNSLMFYDQVKGDPPPLFRLGMPRPLYTTGSAAKVGDTKVCVYDKGRLAKKITARQPGRLLSFVVTEQGFERHAMRLNSGSFIFEPIDTTHTRVTLSTTYTPLMRPRWCWRPFEKLAVHTLHGHVLAGMEKEMLNAE